MGEIFNNPAVAVQSWYVVARSAEVRPGRALSRELARRRVAVYRGRDGKVQALGGRCPHLGADLGRGQVIGDRLQCVFHRWTFDRSGRCVHAPSLDAIPPSARTFSYPTDERYGAVWIFNGPRALFPIPSFSRWSDEQLAAVALPPQTINCHPHVVTCNGLDIHHFKAVHGLEFAEAPVAEQLDPYRIRLRLRIRLRGRSFFQIALRRIAGDVVDVTFTTWGGNLATLEGSAGPVPLLVLFTHRPSAGGRSASQTFLFAPRQRGWRRWIGTDLLLLGALRLIMGNILARDRALLDTLEFRSNLTAADAALATFVLQVNAMQVFDPESSGSLNEPAGADDARSAPAAGEAAP
ncbi:MAG TPA: aromatic ring-hydroxylating dioxygenase subunit alpha [candidate division Zixibacteria bacterium]|nr:aromatic ring-hydroxylating dioxygenase subunit alpha [candidate division Zixibacteria bacterium]